MRNSVLIQRSAIDVYGWELDEEFATFPQGARTKSAYVSPVHVADPCLVPDKRYLFKESKRPKENAEALLRDGLYVEQFWCEIIAYRIGCLLGVSVPPAFASYDSMTGICGALIEWFYIDGQESFIYAEELLKQVRPDFECKRGNDHNLRDNIIVLRTLSQKGLLNEDWRQWWADALLFDTLIGNTDRHQSNWGFLIKPTRPSNFRLCPLFDNGTSMGYDIMAKKFSNWDEEKFERHISRGTHHVRHSHTPLEPRISHIDLLSLVIAEWPEARHQIQGRIKSVLPSDFHDALYDLVALNLPTPLSSGRLSFILRLLELRLNKLKALLS